MTYPQQPAGPAYGYQPQPAFPQQYARPAYQPQNYAQPPVQQAPVATYAPPQFTEPTLGGEGGEPLKIREILGRACGVRPVRFIPAVPGKLYNGKQERDSVVIDILIVDGPVPLEYGESRAFDGTGGPACFAIDALPYEVKGVIVSNEQIVKSAKAVLDGAPGNVIPCRIVRGTVATNGSPPFLLVALGSDLDPQAADADRVRGMLGAAYVAIGTGRWPDGSPYVAPVPREINGGPRQKPTQGQPAQAAPAAQVATYPPQPTASYAPAPQAQVVYPQATAQHPIAQAYNAQAPAGQQYAPQPAAPFIAAGTMPPQAQFAPGSREAYLSGQEAPTGWNLDVWRQQVEQGRAAQFLPQQ